MSEKSIKNTGSGNTFAPGLLDHCPLSLAKFSGICLRMSRTSVHQKLVHFSSQEI